MKKDDVCPEEELSSFLPPRRVVEHLEAYRGKLRLPPQRINVLDWGCGDGRFVLWLREQGYNAFGVDITCSPDADGLFEKKGYNKGCLIGLLDKEGRCEHPDSFFHYAFSSQVLEHVENLTLVARELYRVMAPGSEGLHQYPGHKKAVEVHCGPMPFIHWLPKNVLRRILVSVYVAIGMERRNPVVRKETEGLTYRQRARRCYEYSINKTFYRSYSEVRRTFEDLGLAVRCDVLNHPLKERLGIIAWLTRFQHSRLILEYLARTFVSVTIVIQKRG